MDYTSLAFNTVNQVKVFSFNIRGANYHNVGMVGKLVIITGSSHTSRT